MHASVLVLNMTYILKLECQQLLLVKMLVKYSLQGGATSQTCPINSTGCTEQFTIHLLTLTMSVNKNNKYYNWFTALCLGLPGTRRNIHQLIFPDYQPSFISFFHLLRSLASALSNLCAWQSSCITSLQVLGGQEKKQVVKVMWQQAHHHCTWMVQWYLTRGASVHPT